MATVLEQQNPELFRKRFRWALGVLRRGKWVVLGCMLAVLGPTIIYLHTAKRLYTAQAEVL
ncbi:MAG: hypothetical protein HQL34_12755, partial [Alphaproteobacteria bacterium]|nr:hypothetical protein [Alphaproteobacteria bacterium]